MERIDLGAIAPQPWKNGAGTTREIALGGRSAHFDWRLSLAQIDGDVAFSTFEGIERCLVLLGGGGMRLRSADGCIDRTLADVFDSHAFAGETPLTATLLDGPTSDFNVMTRRGTYRSEVGAHSAPILLQGAGPVFALCVSGRWSLDTHQPVALAPMNGMLWREPPDAVTVSPCQPGSTLLLVRLFMERGR